MPRDLSMRGDASSSKNRHAQGLRFRLAMLALLLAALIGLALAWSWSPLKDVLDIDMAVAALQRFGTQAGALAGMFAFALAVALAVPLTFLTLVTIVAFGPWMGGATALGGALVGAAISFALGRMLGRDAMAKLAGPRLQALSERLGQRGLLAIIMVRLVPIAPFAIVNMVAGVTHIRLRQLLAGTAIGMAPSTLFMMAFVDSMLAMLRNPGPKSYGLVALTIVLIGAGALLFRRWMRKHAS
jgi:uncharacterized membrane protein YdjX (TVP38/TMEM64 family)